MLPKYLKKYNPRPYTKGKRGLIYTFTKNKKKIALKIKNPESKAENRIENEIKFLKILNKYNIGPKLLFNGKNYFCYKFIEGKTLKEYMKNKKPSKNILSIITKQCRIMDSLGINKKEMHKPLKNVIITKKENPVLVDFERCCFTKRPKNTNQFKQFLRRLKCHTE